MSRKNQIKILVPNSKLKISKGRCFRWGELNILPVALSRSLNLFGEAMVISILDAAFTAGLSRDVVWDLTDVSPDLLRSMRVAAKIFRRGVSVSGDLVNAESDDVCEISYEISRAPDLIDCFHSVDSDDVIIVDENVSRYWWDQLPSGFIPMKFMELEKNLDAVLAVIKILDSQLKNNSKVFVVGGGVAGDVVGFAAGLRKIRCHYVPTTLLSMVDSSIGGKVGVNYEPWGKNQIGLFHAPSAVTIWPGWLTTLDGENFRSGLVEALKHAILSGDRKLWSELVEISRTSEFSRITDRIIDIIEIKKAVITRDPFEVAERAVLNFGHTLGHAMEAYASGLGHAVTHGECVAIGMIHALRLSEKYQKMDASKFIRDLVISGVIPVGDRFVAKFGNLDQLCSAKGQFERLLQSDKKSDSDGHISFVLLNAPGKVARTNSGAWTVRFPIATVWNDIQKTWKILASINY